MGAVRARKFDAAIGVGGTSWEPKSYGIDRRLTWVGVGPSRFASPVGYRGPLVSFDRFTLFDEKGPKLDEVAPLLAGYLFGIHRRVVMSDGLSEDLQREIAKLLDLAGVKQGRAARSSSVREKGCPSKQMRRRGC